MASSVPTPLAVSVVILAHQETKRLTKALESIEWADEILLVWNSEHPAPSFITKQGTQLKVVKTPELVHDFAAVRNFAMKKTEHNWVFFLDSDEVAAPETFEKIRRFIQAGKYRAGTVHRQDYFLGQALKWGEVKDVMLVRLVNKNFTTFIRPVHEAAVVEGRVGTTDITIEHYPHESMRSFLQKIIYYTGIEAEAKKKEEKSTIFFQMLFFPPAKFLYNYVWRQGFRDGWRGLIYSVMMSIHSFAVRAQAWEQAT